MTSRISCPHCGSRSLYKDGLRRLNNNTIQRWLCRSCGYRFSNSNHKSSVDLSYGRIVQKDAPSRLNESSTLSYRCQVGASRQGKAKNLAKVESRQSQVAGTTKPIQTNVKGQLVNFGWWMKKQGYADITALTRVKLLKILVKRGADLFDPESIKGTIAKQKWCNKRKVNAADAYSCFLRMHNLTWRPPKYRITRKLPFIPTETEIDQLIAGCSRIFTPLLQLLKETGIRIGEASQIKWIDIDFKNSTVRITPEKGSNPRMFQMSNKLKAMLLEIQGASKSEKVFPRSVRNQRRIFQRQRKKVADKLRNPRIKNISFHTFRHFKATMEYHKTKDILHVMRILGHKNINNTLMYTQLVDFKDDDYVSKVASSPKEACKLVEAGFEHVCEVDNIHIFRKRK